MSDRRQCVGDSARIASKIARWINLFSLLFCVCANFPEEVVARGKVSERAPKSQAECMNLVTVELAHAINDVNGFKEPTLLMQPMSEIVQIQPQSRDEPHVRGGTGRNRTSRIRMDPPPRAEYHPKNLAQV
jgi:hypothetical protein